MGKRSLRPDKSFGIFKTALTGFLFPVLIFQFVSAVIWLYRYPGVSVREVAELELCLMVCFGSVVIWAKAFAGMSLKEALGNPPVLCCGLYLFTNPVIWQAATMHNAAFTCFCGGMVAIDGILLWSTEDKRYKAFRACAIAGGVVIALVGIVNSLSEGSNILVTPEGVCVNQIVVPNRIDDYPKYSDEIQQMWGDENDVYYERTDKFYANLEQNAVTNGVKETRRNMKSMIKIGITNHGKDIAKHYIKDAGLNMFNPIGLSVYMFMNGRTKYGYNLFNFWQGTPLLSMKYMHISTCVCAALVIVGNIAMVIAAIRKKKIKKICGLFIPALLYMFIHTAVQTFVNVPGADYNIGLLSTAVWLILPFMYLIQSDI